MSSAEALEQAASRLAVRARVEAAAIIDRALPRG
jgi:hypothetical protein